MYTPPISQLEAMLKLPVAENTYESGSSGYFDPWELFPFYGCYSTDFDTCAIEVLKEIQGTFKRRDDLAAEMFREMLCKMQLCDYGTSPRVCFATPRFAMLLPAFIEKWEAYSAVQWGSEE